MLPAPPGPSSLAAIEGPRDRERLATVVVPDHDDLATLLADRIVVLNEGRIEQEGTPEEVYDSPANPFVFNFLGNVNLFHGRVLPGSEELAGLGVDT